jgi:ADP-dependent NAD(P)H-hydrate dehydratase / NAD(P)H-hydrate epimerase
VHVPGSGNEILQTAVPEAMTSVDPSASMFTKAPPTESYDAIGIGPGLGQSIQTADALRDVLESGKPMVIDADALNLLSSNRELLHLVPAGSILTPHPGEFERLGGKWESDFDRLSKQLTMARQLKSIVLVKGAHTAIATPEGEIIFNSTGNPGMATGGTGDVLCGILTSFLAQGYTARDAALLGVYIHGLSGDMASAEMGQHSLVAGDLIDFLSKAIQSLD